MDRSQDALQRTTRLIEFLAEVTAAVERNPVIDSPEDPDAPDLIILVDVLADGTLQQKSVMLSCDSVFASSAPHAALDGAEDRVLARGLERTSVRCRSLASAVMSIRAPAVQRPTESLRASGRSRARHPAGPVAMLATPQLHVNRLKRGDFQPT
ncbi:hypothetical protein ACQEVC_34690 [Plantactinospora sp. CA-294935]|uniref:hypothetical protein n=1 Tax=Plantactinospora sp. CA-294935 TaxID=3240012 RepID=UPI003D89B472